MTLGAAGITIELHMPTTLRKRSLIKRLFIVSASFLLLLSAPTGLVPKALADQWDSQLAELRARADQYQQQANALRAQGNTLQNKLDQITAEVNALQLQIQINQQKNDKLQNDIKVNQEKLFKSQELLGEVLANLYVDDNVSSVELLASSQSVTDFVDKQEYRSSIRDQLSTLISEVKAVKSQLEKEKQEVEAVLAELDRQNKQLVAMQTDQQVLVNQTRGEEAAYQNLVNSAREQMAAVAAQQRAYYASLLRTGSGNSGVVGSFQYWGWSGNRGCSGGYPYCAGQDTMVDPWNLYNRECVSYVAWALENRFGRNVQPFHGDGNANQWPSSAPRWSGAYRVYSPQPGDVVVLPSSGWFAPIGHVMIVESVSDDTMWVSQYNFYGTGEYSTMYVKNSGVILLRFP